MLESCCVKTHTLMPEWRAEKPSLTSSPVRPLTSFEAVQSSRTIRVFVPSKAKLVLLADDYIQPWVSLTEPVKRSVVGEGRANQQNVIKLAIEWPA